MNQRMAAMLIYDEVQLIKNLKACLFPSMHQAFLLLLLPLAPLSRALTPIHPLPFSLSLSLTLSRSLLY